MNSIQETFEEDCFYELCENLRHRANMEEDCHPNITLFVDDRNLDSRVASIHDIWLVHNEQELHDVLTTSSKQDVLAIGPLEFEELQYAAYQDVCRRERLLFRRNLDRAKKFAICLPKIYGQI